MGKYLSISFKSTLLAICVAGMLLFGFPESVQALIRNLKLSGDLGTEGQVFDATLSPDGLSMVYLVASPENEERGLFSVPTTGGEIVHLSDELPEDGEIFSFKISPDSQHLVYVVTVPAIGDVGVYSVPVQGGSVVELFGDMAPGRYIMAEKISQDSSTVYFKERANPAAEVLWRVPIGGGEPEPLTPEDCAVNFEITSDSQSVVYNLIGCGESGLYRRTLDGSIIPLHVPSIFDFKIAPDNEYIVYRLRNVDSQFELYSVTMDGSVTECLNGDLVPDGNVLTYEITPDSTYVVYRADEEIDGMNKLYRANIDGAGTRLRLTPWDFPAGGNVTSFKITPNSLGVVYKADQEVDDRFDLFAVSISGALAPYYLTEDMISDGGVLEYEITPNSLGVVFIADWLIDKQYELFATLINGSAITRLNVDLTDDGDVKNFKISNNSLGVVYLADQVQDEVNNLYAVFILGGLPVQVNPDCVDGGDVEYFLLITPDNKGVIYIADQEVDERSELFITYDFHTVYLPYLVH